MIATAYIQSPVQDVYMGCAVDTVFSMVPQFNLQMLTSKLAFAFDIKDPQLLQVIVEL
jgi:hypothetical protein